MSTEHKVETISTVDHKARKVSFRCVCSCGERSDTFNAAGFAAGWEGRHTGADEPREILDLTCGTFDGRLR